MPKPTNLEDIFSLLSTEPPEQKNHFLFLLGTDTVFTERPTQDKSYENGETLSYAAQVLTTQLGEDAEINESEVLSYSSNSVDLMNGPTTLGTEVGERVAQAVFLVLRAIASGKENITIPAHSRGAVQAIMVANELERIKKALAEQPNRSLFDILQAAPVDDDNTHIAEAVRKLFRTAPNDTLEARQELLRRLVAAKINSFLLDPVPGGSKFGLKGLRWHSPRFYEEVPYNSCELIIFRDERTCCFTPIVPNGLTPLVLPGHHGTASGNRYNQQFLEIPASIANRDTTTVQDLVLCKLFYFLNQATNGLFSKAKVKRYDLVHPKLDEVANNFLNADEAERQTLLLEHYTKVKENDTAYLSFSEGSYAYLGRQYTEDKKRFVHRARNRHSSMSDVAPNMGDRFLNQEHARLYLRQFVNLNDLQNSSITEAIVQISALLEKTVAQLLKPTDSELPDQEVLVLLNLLETKDGTELLLSGLSFLVDIISQKYLSNKLSEAEDKNLREVIEKPFRILREANLREGNNSIINRMDTIIKKGLKNTVDTHSQSIFQQIDFIETQIFHREAPLEHFIEVFQYFTSQLTIEEDSQGLVDIQNRLGEISKSTILVMDNEIDPVLQPALPSGAKDFAQELAHIKQILELNAPATIEEMTTTLNQALQQILPMVQDQEKRAQLENFVARKAEKFLQPCFEAHETSIEDYLKNIEHLYHLVITLYKDLPSLQALAGNTIEVDHNQVHYRRLALIEMGGRLLKREGFDLRNKPSYLSEAFFNLIKQQAIMLGAASPEIEDLQQANQSLQNRLNTAQEEANRIDSDFRTASALVAAQYDNLQEAQDSLSTLNTEKGELQQQIIRLTNNYEVNLKGINERLEGAEQKIREKDTLIAGLTSAKEQEHAALIQIKLLPLTNEYLKHLFNSATKYNQNLVQLSDEELPNLDETYSQETRNDYEKIQRKFAIVLGLKRSLEDTINNPLPSLRVQNFKEALENTEALTIHRDGKWKRYAASCGAVLAILCTGIVPGLIAVLIYSQVSGKGNPLFFNHWTRGHAYRSQCTSELSSASSSSAPAEEAEGELALDI